MIKNEQELTSFQKFFLHLRTVSRHRRNVIKLCFKVGIPFQGLVHDLSKYSIKEIGIYKYCNGERSPHEICREVEGYSSCWLHHYHRNKHHFTYWLDEDGLGFTPIKMPYRYALECFCDMVAASKTYHKDNFTESMVYDYWEGKCKGIKPIQSETLYLLDKLFWNYSELGEEQFMKTYKFMKPRIKRSYETGLDEY